MDTTELALSRTFKIANGVVEEFEGATEPTGRQPGDSLAPGVIIDSKYEVISLIGRGGMGAVYKVRHLQLNKEVALKTFLTASLTNDAWLRFQREAQSIARLNDVSIVKIFDFGIGETNIPYYTMELLQGQSLAHKLASSGPLSPTQAVSCFSKVAQGLLHAHKLNIIHRDIKPGNIVLCDDESGAEPGVKLLDFGIAKLLTDQSLDSQKLTHTGAVFGSPLYMSPEQSLGLIVDERSDIYSFACTLFEALTGTAPFVGDNAFATMSMHQSQPAPELSQRNPRGNFNPRLEQMMAKMLAKDPRRRHQSFEDVLNDLAQLTGDRSTDFGHTYAEAEAGASPQRSGLDRRQKLVAAGALLVATALVAAGLALNNLLPARQAAQPTVAKTKPEDEAVSITWTAKPDSKTDQAPSTVVGPRTFYSTVYPDGRRIFHFDDKNILGTLYLTKPQGAETSTQAVGTVVIPRLGRVRLSASTFLANHPDLFDRFRKDDFFEIDLDKGPLWTSVHLEKLAKFSDVQRLKIFQTNLDGRFFAGLDKLKALTSLEIPECETTADDILRYDHLAKLSNFACDSIKMISPVVSRLATSKTMSTIFMEQCNLTDDDLKKMAEIKTLTTLHLAYNDQITEKGLKSLATLPLLRTLYLEGIKFTPDSVRAFKDFKALSRLRLNTSDWSPAARTSLSKALPPKCIVSDSGKVNL